ncbi:MAG: phosphatidylglycerophosphatase A [Deltaproteobacteria bacterium]|nr:phosphatidylglycerophosphatase A [Deltaproteobacteria bacterium]
MYIGYSPYAPGTLGSLLGLIICFFLSSTTLLTYGMASLAVFLIALWAATVAKKYFDKKDPGQIVCDEVMGFITAMFLIPFGALNVIIVFLLFRFFDIVKPFPIGTIDKKIDNGFGIVLDDVAAGVYANIAFRLISSWLMADS